jgi:hypothetical protein
LEITENILDIQKEGESENVILFSPFFPFSKEIIKRFFNGLKLEGYELLFSNLNIDRAKTSLFSEKDILENLSKIIKLEPSKKINIVSFGIFTNIFLELAFRFKERVNNIILIEPDFSNALFKYVFAANRIFFKNNAVKKFYIEKLKSENSDFNFIDTEFLKKFYHKSEEIFPKLKNLIDYLPNEMDLDLYKKNIHPKITPKDNLFFKKYYIENDKTLALNNEEITPTIKIKLRTILSTFELSPRLVIIWNIMARESWPLAQVLEEYKVPVHSLNKNFYSSLISESDELSKIIKSYF